MKKKGNPRKLKKRIRRRQKKKVTSQWGYIPKYRHFCIVCKLIDGTKNEKDLQVHHDKPRSDMGGNQLSNLEVVCDRHHKQLHQIGRHTKIKKLYAAHRKAKFNKIQTT